MRLLRLVKVDHRTFCRCPHCPAPEKLRVNVGESDGPNYFLSLAPSSFRDEPQEASSRQKHVHAYLPSTKNSIEVQNG